MASKAICTPSACTCGSRPSTPSAVVLMPSSRARFKAVGVGVDADHPHRLEHCAALQLVQQVGADVAGPDQGAFDFFHVYWDSVAALSPHAQTKRMTTLPSPGSARAYAVAGLAPEIASVMPPVMTKVPAGISSPACTQVVGQHGHRFQRDGRARPHRPPCDDLAVLLQHYAERAQVELVHRAHARRPPRSAKRGVVGDHALQIEFEIAVAASR